MSTDTSTWRKRIDAARRRRDQMLDTWAEYAWLHTNSFRLIREGNETREIQLPSGDHVTVGAVFRNIEQTLGLLEVPEVTVAAKARDFDRATGREDTHREAIVGEVLGNSLEQSGMLAGEEVADAIKRDAIIIGHGVSYTYWDTVTETEEVPALPILEEREDGTLAPALDEQGQPEFQTEVIERPLYDWTRDAHVPVTELLFEADAPTIRAARWQGWERIVPLEELRADPRLRDTIPAGIQGTAYRRRDLYGREQEEDRVIERDSVKHVILWERATRELHHFLEATRGEGDPAQGREDPAHAKELFHLRSDRFPARFDDPWQGPFNDYVPIPANDHPWGISQVEHTKKVARELDATRTRIANLTRQLKLIMLVQKGKVDPDEVRRALRSDDGEAVEVDLPEGESWDRVIKQIDPAQIPPDLYQHALALEDDVRKIQGIAEQPLGGADTATESENNMAIGGARVNRKRRLYLDYLSRVALVHKAFLAELGPEGQPILVAGADGAPLLLEYGRDVFRRRYRLSVRPGGDGQIMSPVEQKMLVELSGLILGRFSPQADRIWTRHLLTKARMRDINAMLGAMPLQWPGGVPPGGVDGRARAAGPNLNDTGTGQSIRAAINAPNEGAMTP